MAYGKLSVKDLLEFGDSPQWLTLRMIDNDEDALRILTQFDLKPQEMVDKGHILRKESLKAYELLA